MVLGQLTIHMQIEDLDSYISKDSNINPKDINVSHWIKKPLEENIGKEFGILYDQRFFFNKTPKAQATKAKLDKWNYIKFKSFYMPKQTINRAKRQPGEWEENYSFDKRQISRIYKKQLKYT
jgi:hypothetical protein